MDKLVNAISDHLQTLFDTWTGAKSYGVAELVRKGANTVPGIVGEKGEVIYVGPDDTRPVISYHRLTNISSRVAVGGVGSSLGDIINIYTVALVVWMDRKKTGLTQNDMLLYIQANTPDSLTAEPFSKNTIVRFTGAILNSQAVFNTEFVGTDFKLPPEKTMFQINYTLETQFRKDCFAKCPC